MKVQIFSVYDKAVQAYVQPFYARTKAEAVRMFSEACNTADNNLHKNAADYLLTFLGEYDDSSGTFSCVDPVRVISALECLVDDVFPKDKEITGSPDGNGVKPVRRLPM